MDISKEQFLAGVVIAAISIMSLLGPAEPDFGTIAGALMITNILLIQILVKVNSKDA